MARDYEGVFTVMDFAEIFRISESAVRTLIRKGKLQAIKIGGQYRIPKSIVDSFFDKIKRDNYEEERKDAIDKCFGMWADREDIGDGVEYVNRIRAGK
jgi:excisionase family DNA binding protein